MKIHRPILSKKVTISDNLASDINFETNDMVHDILVLTSKIEQIILGKEASHVADIFTESEHNGRTLLDQIEEMRLLLADIVLQTEKDLEAHAAGFDDEEEADKWHLFHEMRKRNGVA